MATLSDYLSLVPSWNADKPKFMNTLAALLQPFVDTQALLDTYRREYDIDTAVGVQLDVVGQWVGRTRYINSPIMNVFFSFDNGGGPRTGFDQGIWAGAYDATYGITALDDDTYRALLKLQAIANHWDGTLDQIALPMASLFPGIVIQDKGDTPTGLMAMDVLIPGPLLSSLLLAILQQDFPVKPSGVHVNFIETTVSTQPIFAFNVGHVPGSPLGGFDEASWGIIIGSI